MSESTSIPSVQMNTQDLTLGERLVIHRRREGRSQREIAEDHGVSLYCYRRWETDLDQPPNSVPLGKLLPYEVCFLLRRRKGISLKELADQLGVSRWWLCKMEYGRANTDRLLAYWLKVSKPWRPALEVSKA